jgi:hypothetical protein
MHPSFTRFAFAAALALALLPARAVDVSGNVIAKSGAPISDAKVCVKSDTSKCVTTNAMGAFHITTAIAIRESGPRTSPYRLDLRNGMLALDAPEAGEAKVEWAGPGGRIFASSEGLRLARGRNVLAVPKGLPENGICFLRLRAAGRTFTWKAVTMQGAASGRSRPGSPSPSSSRIAALAKAAGTSTLEISKTGYRTRIYEPLEDPETDVIIRMSADDDEGLVYDAVFNAKILAIDRAAKSLIVENVDEYCEGANVTSDTTRDTSLYAFVGGKFWLWDKGECNGQVFTSTSSSTDPVGDFTLLDGAAELPGDLKAGCTPGESEDAHFDNFKATYKLTETNISGNFSLEICPADFYGSFFTDFLLQDPNVALTKNTCKQLVFNNEAGESGTLDFSKKGDSLQFAFTYKTEKCQAARDFSFSNKTPVCPEDNGPVEAFFLCMSESGFMEAAALGAPGSMAKTSSAKTSTAARSVRLPMSREDAAQNAGRTRPTGDPMRRGSIFPWHGWRIEPAR